MRIFAVRRSEFYKIGTAEIDSKRVLMIPSLCGVYEFLEKKKMESLTDLERKRI